MELISNIELKLRGLYLINLSDIFTEVNRDIRLFVYDYGLDETKHRNIIDNYSAHCTLKAIQTLKESKSHLNIVVNIDGDDALCNKMKSILNNTSVCTTNKVKSIDELVCSHQRHSKKSRKWVSLRNTLKRYNLNAILSELNSLSSQYKLVR